MMKYLLIGFSAAALVACQPAGMRLQSENTQASADFMQSRTSYEFASEPKDSVAKTSSEDQTSGADPAGIYLAYRYGYGLIMPADTVKPTSDNHMQVCRDAGPDKCQITGSSTTSHSDDNIRANLSLRADPDWLIDFIEGLKVDVAEVSGKIESETTSVEDLTRVILDTDARLKAKRILRARLETLLETRDGELSDLITLERELARVQGEIESATANLRALRARVSMSVVNITYSSKRLAISNASVSPIRVASKDFFRVLSSGVASVIYFFAFMLPWMTFLILPSFFAGRWLWRRRKIRKVKIETKVEKTAV